MSSSGNGLHSIETLDELKKAGFNDKQARAIIKAKTDEGSASKEELRFATAELKRDIKELDTKIETIRSELKRDIKGLDSKLEQGIKLLDTKFDHGIKLLDTKFDHGIKLLDSKLEQGIKEINANSETTKEKLKNDMLVITTGFALFIIIVSGSLITFLKFFQP